MRIFAGYLKKYRYKTGVAVVLLFAEALLCLYVPVLLGNMIGTGIQCKGFADDYPIVISKNAFALFCSFLPDEQSDILSQQYEFFNETPDSFDESYKTKKRCYYIKNDATDDVAEIYRNAVFAAIILARENDKLSGYNYDELADSVSLETIYMFVGSKKFSEEEKKELYDKAEKAEKAVKIQAASLLLAYIYDDAGIDTDMIQSEYLKKYSIITVIAVILQFTCAALSSYFISGISASVEKDIRLSAVKKVFAFSKNEMASLSYNVVHDLISNGAGQIGMSVNYGLRIFFYSFFVAVIGSIITFMKSMVFGLLIISGSVLIVIAVAIIYRITYKKYYRMQENYGKYSMGVRTNLEQLFTIRLMNAVHTEKDKASHLSEKIYNDERFVMKAVLTALSVVGLCVNLLTALIVVAGGSSMLNSVLTLADMIVYIQYSLIVVSSFMMLGAAVIFMPKAVAALRDFRFVMDIPQAQDKYDDNKKAIEGIDSIRFEQVKLFENSAEISFEIRKGQAVAVCAHTGKGKTLLMDALMREFVPFSGDIKVNSDSIYTLSPDYPSKYISYAPSKPVLYTDTLRNNLLLKGAENDNTVLIGALRKSECGFIMKEQNFMNILLKNKGENLSGGQRSRLSVAGNIAKKADVYIFDDCLSSVDRETRGKILKNIYEMKKDAAIIMISSDRSDIADADFVVDLPD